MNLIVDESRLVVSTMAGEIWEASPPLTLNEFNQSMSLIRIFHQSPEVDIPGLVVDCRDAALRRIAVRIESAPIDTRRFCTALACIQLDGIPARSRRLTRLVALCVSCFKNVPMSWLSVGASEVIFSVPVDNPNVRIVKKVRGYHLSAPVRDLLLPEVHRLRGGHCERSKADGILLLSL